MIQIKLLLFGIVSDLVKTPSLSLEVTEHITVRELKEFLLSEHPQLKHIHSYAIAVNESYSTDDTILHHNDTVAIIPPVSGG